jgi:hypothetical protein
MNIQKLPLHLTNTKRSKKMGIEHDYLMRQLMMLFDAIQKILNFTKKTWPPRQQLLLHPKSPSNSPFP